MMSPLAAVSMSAMHWEARRRQSFLDKRMARHKLQVRNVLKEYEKDRVVGQFF